MRYTAEHKTETRRRIVAAAARQFRARGLQAVSVADVMAAAGLTHGGFYAHFGSKDELVAEALREGKGVTAGKVREALHKAPDGKALRSVVEGYLNLGHRARRDQGCILAALAPEASRDTPARKALAERSEGLRGAVQDVLAAMPQASAAVPAGGEATPALEVTASEDLADRARAVMACMVGGLILSRLEEDAEAGERMLAACRKFILEGVGETGRVEGEAGR
jgi:TetR/AcrR family transcriptional repressor of nem operon